MRIPFGSAGQVELDVDPATLVAAHLGPAGAPLADVGEATIRALRHPLAFPDLAQATVPGDRVVIAVGPEVPRASEIAGAVAQLLVDDCAISPANITLLTSGPGSGDLPLACPPEVARQIVRVEHRGDDPAELAYLAAHDDGSPIYLNRALCNADLVLPIGLLQPTGSLGGHQLDDSLYPTFSNVEALNRYRQTKLVTDSRQQRRGRAEAEQVAWLLGSQLTVQVVAGLGNSLHHLLAGEAREVGRRGLQLVNQAWQCQFPYKADLVIATLVGDQRMQTWHQLARAVYVASQAAREAGTIAVCCELDERPGPALRQLAALLDPDQLRRELRRSHAADTIAATVLCEALESQHVYLLSRLEAEVVEEMGLGYIADVAELDYLVQRSESCAILANAQRAGVVVGEPCPHDIDEFQES